MVHKWRLSLAPCWQSPQAGTYCSEQRFATQACPLPRSHTQDSAEMADLFKISCGLVFSFNEPIAFDTTWSAPGMAYS